VRWDLLHRRVFERKDRSNFRTGAQLLSGLEGAVSGTRSSLSGNDPDLRPNWVRGPRAAGDAIIENEKCALYSKAKSPRDYFFLFIEI
jgi:hypothetical protein